MTKEEIIAGQIYQAVYPRDKSVYIFEPVSNIGYKSYLRQDSVTYCKSEAKDFNFCQDFKVSPATPQQIRHFNACREAGKYVDIPKEEVINSYQIF